jgi:hypothetical protein
MAWGERLCAGILHIWLAAGVVVAEAAFDEVRHFPDAQPLFPWKTDRYSGPQKCPTKLKFLRLL